MNNLGEKINVAILLTCHSRRALTLNCLSSVMKQGNVPDINIDIYLVDDGSTDGTGEAVRGKFPSVNVLEGDGNLFWSGGMRVAWQHAFEEDYDYFLWLNDDTFLYHNTLSKLLETAKQVKAATGKHGIICGSTRDPETGATSYGGRLFHGFWKKPAFSLIETAAEAVSCDTINGNCVLIPKDVAKSVGNLSPDFKHDLSDFDYGLRALKLGFSCWVAPGYAGKCRGHSIRGSCFDVDLAFAERLKQMKKPSGLPLTKDWLIFTRRHGGFWWPLFWLKTGLRIFIPYLWLWLRGQSTEQAGK